MISKQSTLSDKIRGMTSTVHAIEKLPLAVESRLSHAITKATINPKDEIKDVTQKDRIMHAALGGLLSLASGSFISKVILKNKKLSLPLLATGAAFGAITGYHSPDAVNAIRREVRGEVSTPKTRKILMKNIESGDLAFQAADEIINPNKEDMDKDAAFIGSAARLLGKGIGKSVSGTSSFVWKGAFPGQKVKSLPFGRKAQSYLVRGGLTAGAGYGAYKGIRAANKPRSGANYNTFLRNQILAGNVNPGELSQRDLVSVRNLGMN